MKVKDFLDNYLGCVVIKIHDSYDCTDHRYCFVENVIKEYGGLNIKVWTVERDGTLVIVVNSQF